MEELWAVVRMRSMCNLEGWAAFHLDNRNAVLIGLPVGARLLENTLSGSPHDRSAGPGHSFLPILFLAQPEQHM